MNLKNVHKLCQNVIFTKNNYIKLSVDDIIKYQNNKKC